MFLCVKIITKKHFLFIINAEGFRSMRDLELEELQKHQKLNKQQLKDIHENIWTKLYMLQNYDITMDMFKGSILRWSTLNTLLGYIRSYCNNSLNNEKILSNNKSMLRFIQGLMDSGTEPYPAPKTSQNKVLNKATLNMLLRDNILTQYQINQIYDTVGYTQENPDTSSAWTCATHEYTERNRHWMDTCKIVDSLDEIRVTNPLQVNKSLKFIPVKLRQGKTLIESIAESFKK